MTKGSKYGSLTEKLKTGKLENLQTSHQENPQTRGDSAAPGNPLPTQERQESKEAGKPENLKTDKPASTREKYSTYLDSELVLRLRLHATKSRLKDYQVVEAAIQAYLDKHDP